MFDSSVALAMMALSALTAPPQDPASDWDMTENDERQITAASTTFSSGVSVILRCAAGQFDAVVTGLPPAAAGEEWRTVSLQFGDAPPQEEQWFVGANNVAVISRLPARLARQLREGGLLKLRVQDPAQGGRRVRFDLDLPASTTNVDRTLRACDRPTTDPRDEMVEQLGEGGLPGGIVWERQPEPQYPDGRTFDRGFVVTSCLNRPDGQLTGCVIESEFPLGGGFGQEALRAAQRARVRVDADPSAPVPTRMIIYSTNFRMMSEGESARRGAPTGSRIARDR